MPYYNSDPKRDHNFDNHPSRDYIAAIQGGYRGIVEGLEGHYPNIGDSNGNQTMENDMEIGVGLGCTYL